MSKIKCLCCDSILESVHTHDFHSCDCENRTYIDGGNDYMKFGCMAITKVLFWDEETKEFVPFNTTSEEVIVEEQKEGAKCSGGCPKCCLENR